MTNQGKENSYYFFELEYHPVSASGICVGVAPKLENYNAVENYNKGCYYCLTSGEKWCFGKSTSFLSQAKSGDKIGVLVDMFEGSVKFFVNNADHGWVYKNEDKLKQNSLFVTIYI